MNENTTATDKLSKKNTVMNDRKESLKVAIETFFNIFSSPDLAEEIFSDAKMKKISSDIYNHFIDVESILSLPKDRQISYANNLGIEVNEGSDIISDIVKQQYIQNYKKDLLNDMDYIVDFLGNESPDLQDNETSYYECLSNIRSHLS
jgi:hypothetical protein